MYDSCRFDFIEHKTYKYLKTFDKIEPTVTQYE